MDLSAASSLRRSSYRLITTAFQVLSSQANDICLLLACARPVSRASECCLVLSQIILSHVGLKFKFPCVCVCLCVRVCMCECIK
jgi:hypothetical protein